MLVLHKIYKTSTDDQRIHIAKKLKVRSDEKRRHKSYILCRITFPLNSPKAHSGNVLNKIKAKRQDERKLSSSL